LGCNLDKRKIHLTYGAGKDLITYGIWKRFFDLILAYGRRDNKLFSLYTQSRIVGNPKFDDWFNGEFDEEMLFNLKSRLDSNKKTILYLPTHSDLSSIDRLAAGLKRIAKKYNVLVKLHYYTPREEPERVKKLTHKDIILFKDDVDLLPLLKFADVALSDNSSAIFDVILADKPIVLTDFLSDDYLDIEHRKPRYYRRGEARALTYSGSIEQKIKKEGLIITIKKPKELEEAVEKALKDEFFYQEARRAIRNELFAFQDGRCGRRAAQAIREFLSLKELPERPLLYHLLETFEMELRRQPSSERKMNIRKIKEYEALLSRRQIEKIDKKLLFSIILLIGGANEHLRTCFKSLFNQDFPSRSFEVIVADYGPMDGAKEIIELIEKQDNFEGVPIKYLRSQSKDIGPALKEGLNNAEGKFICFALPQCFYPANWLNNLLLAYEKHPTVAGVGGYLHKETIIHNIFDEYYCFELARKMGISKETGYLNKLYEIKNNLFYQNPAGVFGNMSYKSEILKNSTINYSQPIVELLENEIKKQILDSGTELIFIPVAAFDFEKATFKKFVSKNFQEGIAYFVLWRSRPALKKYYKYTIFSVIKSAALNILDNPGKIKLTLAIFVGHFFRLMGKWYALASVGIFKIKSRPSAER